MYSKILVPLDGSSVSETVLPYARLLANSLKLSVELLRVNDSDLPAASSPPSRGLEYLETIAHTFSNNASTICTLRLGKPAEAILDRAEQAGTLIVMGTHGRSGVRRWLLGSVAEKVLQGATNPLLLVRGRDRETTAGEAALKKLIVPLDGSHLAELVLPYAMEVAARLLLEMVLVRVYDLPSYETLSQLEWVVEEFREEATSYLREKARQLKAEGVRAVSYLVPRGKAAEEIVEIAQDTPESLVAISTHGRTGIGRWVLGSVTDRVVRYSGDPVLVIRAQPGT
ncbi:MAG: universal stress protein [Deltaproteobacteria bacterium]|nr:universal stress protein [Deltaproteobacteria bacterium]